MDEDDETNILNDEETTENEEDTINTSNENITPIEPSFNSTVMNDIPQASSLFNAVLNKTERNDVDAQLENALSSSNNNFSSKTNTFMVEEEPELFSTPQNFTPAPKIEEQEKLIIGEDDNRPRTWAERLAVFSIAKRNNKKKVETEEHHYQEPITPSFAENDDFTSPVQRWRK